MRAKRLRKVGAISAVVAIAVSAFLLNPDGRASHTAAAPAAPTTAGKSRVARPTIDLRSILEQTGAVIRTVVTAADFSYSDSDGPRTNVTFSGITTIVGDKQPATMRLSFFGGPVPGGGVVLASHIPRFQLGEEYIVLLRNTDWYLTPTVEDNVFRIVRKDGKRVLVDTDGASITGITALGFTRGDRFFDTAGDKDSSSAVSKLISGKTTDDVIAGSITETEFEKKVNDSAASMSIAVGGWVASTNLSFPTGDWRKP